MWWEGIEELLEMLECDGGGKLLSCGQCSFYPSCGSVKEEWKLRNKCETAKAAKDLQCILWTLKINNPKPASVGSRSEEEA